MPLILKFLNKQKILLYNTSVLFIFTISYLYFGGKAGWSLKILILGYALGSFINRSWVLYLILKYSKISLKEIPNYGFYLLGITFIVLSIRYILTF